MKSLLKPSTSAVVGLAVISVLGSVTALTGCGSNGAQSNAPAMQDSMKSDGMMNDGMKSDGMMKDGMMKEGMMKDGAAPVDAEMKSDKKM